MIEAAGVISDTPEAEGTMAHELDLVVRDFQRTVGDSPPGPNQSPFEV